MATVSDIFDRLGGPAAVGRIIGKPVEHATLMRRRQSIPVAYWPAIIAHTKGSDHGVTYADLVAAHAPALPHTTPARDGATA